MPSGMPAALAASRIFFAPMLGSRFLPPDIWIVRSTNAVLIDFCVAYWRLTLPNDWPPLSPWFSIFAAYEPTPT